MSNLLMGKLDTIARCVGRIRQTWAKPSDTPFAQDFDKQDIIIVNLQRISDSLLDCCKHVVRARNLGWPKNNRETIELLAEADLVDAEARSVLVAWNGMRNILVHRYRDIDLDIVTHVVEHDLDDALATARTLARHAPAP